MDEKTSYKRNKKLKTKQSEKITNNYNNNKYRTRMRGGAVSYL